MTINLRELINKKLDEKLQLAKGLKSASVTKKPRLTESSAPRVKAATKKVTREVLSESASTASKFKKGSHALYKGQEVVLEADITSGLVPVRTKKGSTIMVRPTSLSEIAPKTNGKFALKEAWMAAIPPTYIASSEPTDDFDLSAADLGLDDLVTLHEDDDKDEQEEDHDNGSNVRHDGHTNKTQIDALPKPSDTVSTAYDEDKPPKEQASALTTLDGAEVASDPDLGGYDQPADAPEIPNAKMQPGGNAANASPPSGKAPTVGSHKGDSLVGDSKKDSKKDVEGGSSEKSEKKPEDKSEKKETKESTKVKDKSPFGKREGKPGNNKKSGTKQDPFPVNEEGFMGEPAMDDTTSPVEDEGASSDFGSEPSESPEGSEDGSEGSSESGYDAIKITPAALAAVLTTVVKRQCDETMLKAIVEALSECGHKNGGEIDVPDLQAVAAHINGEEAPEAGAEMGGEESNPVPAPAGDGEPTTSEDGGEEGQEKLMASVDLDAADLGLLRESVRPLSDDEEIRALKKRIGQKYWGKL